MIYGKEIRDKERKNSKLEESKTKKQHSPRTLSSKKAGNEMKIHKTSQGKFLKHTHCYLSSQTPSRNSPRNPIFYAQSVLENTTKTVTNRNRNREWKPAVSKDRFLWYFSFRHLSRGRKIRGFPAKIIRPLGSHRRSHLVVAESESVMQSSFCTVIKINMRPSQGQFGAHIWANASP